MKKNNQSFESARKQVDKYAAGILGRISDEKERNSRGFQVAKLYVNIKEYGVAKRYMAGFLAVKPSYAPAHRLMGQIYEKLGDTKKAIAAYKLSLELDDSQKDILLTICELYCTTDIDPEQAKYWADRVEKVFPRKNIAFRLREKIYSTTGNLDINHNEMAQLLAQELKKHPRDVALHMKLLRLYIDQGRFNEAYAHAVATERLKPYPESLEWYQCLVDVLQEYQQENRGDINGVFHEQLLGVLCNLTAVSLSKANIFDCMEVLHKLDETLQKVSEMQLSREAWRHFLEEIKAQFFYHAGTLLCKKAKQLRLSWREACDMAAACFAVSATVLPLDTQANWFRQVDDKSTYEHWARVGALRLSQVAHMLADMKKCRDSEWPRTLQAEIFTQEGQKRLFQLLFNTPHLQQNCDRSYLLNCSAFDDISMEIPSSDTLQLYNDMSDQLLPHSLHHIVWKALHHYSVHDRRQPQYDFKVFADLYEGGVNVDQTTAPETLCQYDIEAFLCLTVHCAALRLAEYERSIPDEPGRPRLLPAAICDTLSLPQQQDWWQATYCLYSNSNSEDLGRLRLTVSSGLGVLRMRGQHGLDPRLGIHLARTFQQRWEDAIEAGSPDVHHRQSRALYYWRSVVDSLSDLDRQQKHGHRIQRPRTQLFPLTDSHPLSEAVLKECADEGRFLLGRIAMTEERIEEAINQFKLVNTPSANLDLGKAYRELAARVVRQPQLNDPNADGHLQQVALLTKARDVLYETFGNVARRNNQELYTGISDELELVEAKLNDLGVTMGTRPKLFVGRDESDLRRSPERATSFAPHSPVTPASPATSERDDAPRHLGVTDTPQPTNTNNSYHETVFCLVNQLEESRKTIEKLKEKVERLEMRGTPTHHPPFPGYPGGSPMYYPGPYPPAPGYGALMPGIPPTPPFPMMQQSPAAVYQSPQFVPPASSGGAGDVYNGGVTTTRYNGEEFVTVEDTVDPPQPPADWSAYAPMAHMMTPRPPMPPMRPPIPGVGLFTPPGGYGLSNLPMPRPGFFARPGAAQPPPSHIPPEIATPPGGVLQQDTSCGPNRNRSARGVVPPKAPSQETPWAQQLNDYSVEFPPETQDLFVSSTPYLGHYQPPQQSANAPNTDAPQSQENDSMAEVRGHDATSYDEQDYEDEHVLYRNDSHDPEFTPIVQLPEEVELVTGEEDSTPLFSNRAKLYRFIDSQWKERGVGTIKILYNAMLGRTRVVMRRDQVHKVCANHPVQPGATITYKDEEKKTLLWTALDFTDDDGPHMENFCCRFKTAETAAQFKEMYEQAKGLSGTSDAVAATNQSPGGGAKASDKSAEKPISLSTLFGPKPGSWECDACLVRNSADMTVCLACMTPKPGSEVVSQEREKSPVAAISMSAGGGFKFAAAAQFGAVAFSSTPVKSNNETSSFHTPATFSFGTPTVSSSPAVVSGQSNGQTQGVTTAKPSPAVTSFGKTDAETKQMPAESDQTVPASFGITGSVAVTTATAAVSSAPASSFAFAAQSTSGTKAPFSFGTAKFGETVSSTSKTSAQSSVTETKTVIGGFSFVGPNVTQTVAVTTATPVTVSVKATDKPNPFASFSFSSPKAEVVSTASDTGPVKPFNTFGSDATSAAPIFGGTTTGSMPAIFGGATSAPVFGSTAGTTATASASSIFGGAAAAAPIFGSAVSTTNTTKTSSIFGGTAAAPIFGSTVGTANTTKTSSIFGGATAAPIFGGATAAPIFGGAVSSSEVTSTSSVFGSVSSSSVYDSASSGVSTFSTFSSTTPAPIFGSAVTTDNPTSDINGGMTFGNSASAITFASIAAKGESPDAFVKKSESATGFQMGTGKLFESLTSPGGAHDTSDGHTDDYEPTAEFEPVVSLPHVVELKTGEEDEDKIFSERARLYRLDNDTKQWKERGIGVIKILKHRHTGKHRIVMRREQVLKLCANHNIGGDMTLRPLATSDRAWCWFARDFAEDDNSGEGTLEHLAAKFKTPEIAVRFKDVFEDCVKQVANASWDTYEKNESTTTEDRAEAGVSCGNLADMFRLKNGEWQCDVCLVKNVASAAQCAACTTPRPSGDVSSPSKPVATSGVKGSTLKLAELLSASEPEEPKKVGKEQSLAELFRTKDGEWECDACLVKNRPGSTKCAACETPKPGSKQDTTVSSSVSSSNPLTISSTGGFNFSFGSGDASKSVSPSTGFRFDQFVSSSTGTFTFGATDVKSSGVPSLFGTPAVPTGGSTATAPSGFTFSATLSTPGNQPLDLSKSPLQSPELYHEEETNVYFEPLVHLPDDYEVKTGEEDEEVLYVHRAKLYRFHDGEWKDRGLGDVKLLRHRTTRRTRVLMRREQVLKICLNHQLAPELELKPMAGADGCAWVWHADDFADGSSKHEQFAIRFKAAQDAEEFKSVFDSAKEGKETGNEGAPPSFTVTSPLTEDDNAAVDSSDSGDDVIVVSEKRPTPEQVERARAWQLPDTFYLYEDAPPCPGCCGCDPDDLGAIAAPSRIPRPQGKTPTSESTTTNASQSQILRQPRFSAPSLEKGPAPDKTTPKAEKSTSLPRFVGFGLPQPSEGSAVGGAAGTEEGVKSPLKELLFGGSKLGQVIPSATSSSQGLKTSETAPDPAGALSESGGGIVFGRGNKFSGEGFAALAAQSSTGFAFGKKSDEPFAFSGAGTTLFGANSSMATDQDSGDDSYISHEANIHFEPVVSLPEVTDLKTGEEGCDVLFCQRAKLYRFTDGEWKERGIGEMKLLRNTETGRVRVLLRREQVLKLACNHNLTADMKLQPLLTSETAWCWSALDYIDSEGRHEQLAVKFKTKDIATQFKDIFEECQRRLVAGPADEVDTDEDTDDDDDDDDDEDSEETSLTEVARIDSAALESDATPRTDSLSDTQASRVSGTNVDGDEQSYDDYEEEEDDQAEQLFWKRTTMYYIEDGKPVPKGQGELYIIVDEDVAGLRIYMAGDSGDVLCNHVICCGYTITKTAKNCCEWTAQDWSTDDEPIARHFRAALSSTEAVEEFIYCFQQGVQRAQENQLYETMPEIVPISLGQTSSDGTTEL